ncbi:MAG: hypothetical protein AAFY03_11315, partial [Pseudomonadota bacterium]
MTTTNHIVRISSDDQNMWAPGDAFQIGWSEYFPIIGGEKSTFTVTRAEITQGSGKVVINDERVQFDAEGTYDDLSVGATRTVVIEFDIRDEDGNVTTKTAEIGVEMGNGGPIFTHAEGGVETTGRVSIMAVDAEDMLQDVHRFQTVTPIDIEFDAQEALGEDIAKVTAGITAEIDRVERNKAEAERELDALEAQMARLVSKEEKVLEYNALNVKAGAEYIAAQAASQGANAAREAYRAWENAKVEESAAKAAQFAAQGTLNAASTAVSTAQNLVNGAKNLLADAVGVINDVGAALGKFVGDAAYYLELGVREAAIEAAKLTWWTDSDDRSAKAARDKLVNDKKAYDKAQADKARHQNDLDRFEGDLRDAQADFSAAQQALNEANAAVTAAIKKTADAWNDFSAKAGGKTVQALEAAANAAWAEYQETIREREAVLKELQSDGYFLNNRPDPSDALAVAGEITAKGLQITAKQAEIWGNDGYQALLDVASAAWDKVTDSNVAADVEVSVDAFAQAGLIVDFELDGGSVDTDLDFN